MPKHVLVTGGTGFIGSPVVAKLKERGYKVSVLSHCPSDQPDYYACNLLKPDEVTTQLKRLKPEFLVHLAWDVSKPDYLNSGSNLDWAGATLHLFKEFAFCGGKWAFLAGTCFEYSFSDLPLEEDGMLSPKSVYAAAKVSAAALIREFACSCDIPILWGRYFYLFGKNERQSRAVPYIIRNLLEGKPVICKNSQAVRDYLCTEDAAEILVKALEIGVSGNLNICSGKKITMGELFCILGKLIGKPELITLKNEPVFPEAVYGDLRRLKKECQIGESFDIVSRLKETIAWWANNLSEDSGREEKNNVNS